MNTPYIKKLPDELLLIILELSITPPSRHISADDPISFDAATKWALTLVCRRFNRLATPLLYRTMSLTVLPASEMKAFYRIEPSYRQFCQGLIIGIMSFFDDAQHGELGEADWLIATDFLTGFTKVKYLAIQWLYNPRGDIAWDFVTNILEHMRSLQHLSLRTESGCNLLPRVMEYVDASSFQVLSLEGSWWIEEANALHGYSRKAPFTTLHLLEHVENATATGHMICWPRELHHFHFGSLHNNSYYMDLDMFGDWLLTHRNTLRTIDIGYLAPAGQGRLFDATQFPNLTSLKLSRYLFTGKLESPEADARCLLAPKLEMFTWDFTKLNGESWKAIGGTEERWLEKFAEVAALTSSSLKMIRVQFSPEVPFVWQQHKYPWDHLDWVKEVCRPLGISLEYNDPPLSRNAWLDYS